MPALLADVLGDARAVAEAGDERAVAHAVDEDRRAEAHDHRDPGERDLEAPHRRRSCARRSPVYDRTLPRSRTSGAPLTASQTAAAPGIGLQGYSVPPLPSHMQASILARLCRSAFGEHERGDSPRPTTSVRRRRLRTAAITPEGSHRAGTTKHRGTDASPPGPWSIRRAAGTSLVIGLGLPGAALAPASEAKAPTGQGGGGKLTRLQVRGAGGQHREARSLHGQRAVVQARGQGRGEGRLHDAEVRAGSQGPPHRTAPLRQSRGDHRTAGQGPAGARSGEGLRGHPASAWRDQGPFHERRVRRGGGDQGRGAGPSGGCGGRRSPRRRQRRSRPGVGPVPRGGHDDRPVLPAAVRDLDRGHAPTRGQRPAVASRDRRGELRR